MIEDIVVNIIAGIILIWLGWIARTFYNRKKYSVFRFVRKFKVFHSGAQGYYYSFPPEDNKKAWEGVKRSFCYLGISTNTFNNELLDFMKTEQGKNLEYRFLLLNPTNNEVIQQQEAFKNGYKDLALIDATKKEKLKKDVENTKKNILLCIEKIRNTDAGNVTIKFFDEFLPWWMYVFDERKIFLGLLEFGKSGRESPLVVLEKNEKYFTLFDAFMNNWNRMWDSATESP
jgi:hypothetical protein